MSGVMPRMRRWKPPYMPLYVDDILGSFLFQAMTAEQKGWYLMLLMQCWHSDRGGYLPKDPQLLWKLAGARSRRYFERHSAPVLAKFKDSGDGWLYNERCLQEYERVQEKAHIFSEAGRKGARSRSQPDLWAGSGEPQGKPQPDCQGGLGRGEAKLDHPEPDPKLKMIPPTPLKKGGQFSENMDCWARIQMALKTDLDPASYDDYFRDCWLDHEDDQALYIAVRRKEAEMGFRKFEKRLRQTQQKVLGRARLIKLLLKGVE